MGIAGVQHFSRVMARCSIPHAWIVCMLWLKLVSHPRCLIIIKD